MHSSVTPSIQSDIDYFEQMDQLPAEVAHICNKFMHRFEHGPDAPYEVCKDFQAAVERVGFTFEFGLDGEPYGLKPLREPETVDLDAGHPAGNQPAVGQ